MGVHGKLPCVPRNGRRLDLKFKKWVAGVCVASAVAVGATMGASAMAFASATTDISDINGGSGANWTVPTTPMTNTVWKDKDGNVVAANTKGATQYKVLTTWAEAWSTSGPDYLGVSNSAYYGNGGNGNAKVTNYVQAQKNSMVGIWATSANESPNAYNWNTFYNFYAEAQNKTASDWTTVSTTSNGGSDWDSASGVWCGFKYRPEVVWLNNNLNASATATYVKQINDGQYSATATKNGTYAPNAGEDGKYDSSFAVYGDSTYNPTVIQPNNNSPYSFVASAYELANASEKIISSTASNPGLSSGETLDWKTVNKLPRSNRYSESVTECALNIEKLARGSVYYTLSKIADGTVNKKKVAYVAYPANYSSTDRSGKTTVITDSTHVVVAVYDYTECIGQGSMDGRASWSPLAVDQLSTDSVYKARSAGGSVASNDNSTTTFTLYNATADDLASCDVIYSPQNSVTASEWQSWIEQNATPANAKKASKISYIAASPAITNGSNFTMEKLIYGAYAMDCFYPELFPNMQLSTFWFNKVYHIKSANLGEVMSWGYAKASLPAGTSLATIGNSFNVSNVLAKFEAGYQYFTKNKTSDATIVRVLANKAIDGSTTGSDGNAFVFNGFEPTSTWTSENHSSYNGTMVQSLKVTPASKTIKFAKVKKSKQTVTIKVAGNNGKVSYSVTKAAKKAGVSVSSKGKVTINKGTKKGTYKVTVKAAKSGLYKAASKTVKIVVK